MAYDLNDILAKALSLEEQLAVDFVSAQTATRADTVPTWIQAWRQRVAEGDAARFEKRLAWDGLDITTTQGEPATLGSEQESSLPGWAATFRKVMGEVTSWSKVASEKETPARIRFLQPKVPVPFEEFLTPFIVSARNLLASRAGGTYALLSETAHARLERSLLGALAQVCGQALYVEFVALRTAREALRLFRGNGESGTVSEHQHRTLYDQFVQETLEDEGLAFFREYSVLARLVATLIDSWVDATAELLQRLENDGPDIQATFLGHAILGQVTDILPDLSDRHDWGRSVMALHFASGLKLIYKPRSVSLETTFNQLLAWCNRQQVDLPFRHLTILERATYGWVEYVEQSPCQSAEEARRYYTRAGMLLCLLYVLEGIDFHVENSIASGEYPVLVDLEALMHPRLAEPVEYDGQARAHRLREHLFQDSVLRTGFLPTGAVALDNRGYDASGLSGHADQQTAIRGLTWKHINTDGMELVYESQKTAAYANLPVLGDYALSADDYTDEIERGFTTMYRFLMEHRGALLAPEGPIVPMAHQQVRFIFRPTEYYQSILLKSLHPRFLRNGLDRSRHLDVLCKSLLASAMKPSLWPLLAVERRALEHLDIPRFTAYADDDGLSLDSGERIEHCFVKPSFDVVTDRLKKLSDEDLGRQLGLLRASLSPNV